MEHAKRATRRGVTGRSPGTLQLAALPGALAICLPLHLFILFSHTQAYYYYIYRVFALAIHRHPCNLQPFLRETCSPLHAISTILLLLAPRSSLVDWIKSWHLSLSVSLSLGRAFRVIACICRLLFSVHHLQVQPGQWVGGCPGCSSVEVVSNCLSACLPSFLPSGLTGSSSYPPPSIPIAVCRLVCYISAADFCRLARVFWVASASSSSFNPS